MENVQVELAEEVINVTVSPEQTLLIELNEGVPGIQGPAGPQGEPGPEGPVGPRGESSGSYLHDQANPAFVWTIQHNLGFLPNVTIFDHDDNMILGWTIFYESENILLIRFSMVQSGIANLS